MWLQTLRRSQHLRKNQPKQINCTSQNGGKVQAFLAEATPLVGFWGRGSKVAEVVQVAQLGEQQQQQQQ